jgi:alkanesulfonate monooxygenase SsuD/methylene tetrahydromethanopterin reductase-like flavin-dependent oxidoreductase (luciferase family)
MQTFVGEPQQMIEHLQQYADVGVSEIVCLFGSADGSEVIDQMSKFASEVMPAFS